MPDPLFTDRAFNAILDDIGRVPLMPEDQIDGYLDTTKARLHHPGKPAGTKPLPLPTTVCTRAEIQVLVCLADGLTFKQAAAKLHKSLHTVKKQGLRAQRKLHAANSTHACCNAIRQGLIV